MREHPLRGNLSSGDGEGPSGKEHDYLLAQLSSPNWRVREAAVEEIVALDDRNLTEAVLNLVRENSADLNAISSALKTLEQIGRPLTAKMIGLLRTAENAEMRVLIPILLGNLGDASAAAGLIDVVVDPQQSINARFNAIEALGKLRIEEAVPLLRQMIATGESYLRYAAVVALGLIGRPEVEQDLLQLLEDDYLAEPAITTLGQIGSLNAVTGLTIWMNRAAKSNSCRIEPAVQALAAIARRQKNPVVVRNAFLSALDRQTVSCLVSLMEDPDSTGLPCEDLASVLSWAVHSYPERRELWTALVRLLEDPKSRPVVIETLRTNPGQAEEELITALQSPSAPLAKSAAYLVGELRIQKAGSLLEQTLESGEEDLAAQSAEALGRLGRKEAGERLLAALAHPGMQVRRAAAGALAAIQPPGLVDQVKERTRDSNPRLRETALRLLAQLDDKHGAAAALRSLSDEDLEVRVTAVELLPRFNDPQVVPALAQALVDPDVNLRIAAARALGEMPTEDAVPLLKRAARDEDGWVRMHATRSLSRFTHSDILPDILDRLADAFPPVRIAAVNMLSGYPLETSRPILEKLLQDGNDEVRDAAGRVLRKIASGPALGGNFAEPRI